MAENAELLLKVGLDLAHFRRQLNNVGSQLAGQPLSINIKLDRSKVVSEFRLLDRYIRNKKFYVEVNTNLKTEVDRAVKLTELLKNMPRGGGASRTPGVVEAGFSQAQLRKLKQDIKPLYKAAADAGLIAFDEAIANNVGKIAKELSEVGKSSVTGLLNGLASGDAQVRAAAQNLGQILISTIKATLGIASPSKETGKLGKFAAEGFEKGFVAGMIKAERAIAQAVSNAVIGAIYEGLTTVGNIAPAFVPLERALATQIRQSFQRAMRDGMKESIKPGIQGGLLGLLGGGMTGAALGGARALSGATTAGLSTLGSGGKFEIAKQLGRLTIGDTSGLTNFVQEAANQAIHQAFSTGTLGALLGAAAVSGVAGSSGFVRGAIGSLTRQILEGIADRILAGIASITSGDIGPATGKLAQAIINVLARDLEKRVQSMNIAFPSMLPALPPAYRGLPQAGGNAFGALPPAYRGLPPGRTIPMLPPAYRGLPMGGFDFAAMGAMPKGGASDDPGGKIVSLESGFIAAMRERFARAAERYLFGIEAQILDLYDAANAAVRVKIDRAIARLEAQIRARGTPGVSVRDLGVPVQPLLTGGALPPRRLALPAAGESGGMLGTSTTVTGGGVTPRGGFPSGGGGNFRGIGGPGGGMGGALPTLNLPGSGVIRELGQEFAFATKQVLLFGQAYKLLAFIQDFPGQVGQAVGQLQSFRNTLNAISPSAAEAAKSNQFILDIVDRYNIPIQSARDGFTKLYASMEPAGFRGEEIRGLFESISMGAATFGMSADKVDRVIYAFSQMASKGQVMSEELKGQLGDVLPGAMALFAEAAGFKGPEAITKFSKALEDGVFKGDNMVKLLKNVRVVMEQEFGPGAEGAARTFQGGINRMQNSLRQLYEAFEPVAVGFMNQVVKPLTDGIRVAADGFTAFFQGVAAKTPQGAVFAQELERLKPALEGIGNNLRSLLPTFELFGNILLNVGKLLLAIAGNPIVGFLLKVYTNVLLVNAVFSLLGGKILLGLIASTSTTIARFIALNVQMGLLQRTSAVTGSTLAGTQLQMALLTRNASAAVGPVGMLATALKGIAALGIITVAINLIVTGLGNAIKANQEIAKLRGQRQSGGQAALYGGSVPLNDKTTAQKTLQAIKAERRRGAPLATRVLGSLAPLVGAPTPADILDRVPLLKEREMAAKGKLTLPTRAQAAITATSTATLDSIAGGKNGEGGGKGKGGGADKAAKAAERAAQERRELNATLEQLREQLRIERQSLETQETVALARADGNEKLASFLQVQEKYYEIDEKASKLQKDFDAKKIGAAEFTLKQQLLAIERKKVEITEEERLNAVLRERFGITNDVMEAARKARENAFGLNLGGAAGFRTDVNLDPNAKQTRMDEMRQKLDDLVKTENQVYLGAQAIGEAFGTAFKGIASGAMTAQEALAGMMSSIASHFLDMAAQIITQQMTMIIYGTIMKALGLTGGIGGGFGVDFSGAFGAGAAPIPGIGGAFGGGMKLFAEGGFVTGPTSAVIGEGGEPEYIIPASKMRSAMSRYATGARGSAVIPAGDDTNAGGGTATMAPTAIDVRYTIERINSVDYVTADQFRAGMAQAAQQGATQGEQRTLRRLQQSRATRSRLGMN